MSRIDTSQSRTATRVDFQVDAQKRIVRLNITKPLYRPIVVDLDWRAIKQLYLKMLDLELRGEVPPAGAPTRLITPP